MGVIVIYFHKFYTRIWSLYTVYIFIQNARNQNISDEIIESS